jgi:hypothetical protein
VIALYSLALLVSAALLFLLEPMSASSCCRCSGAAPEVWPTTVLVPAGGAAGWLRDGRAPRGSASPDTVMVYAKLYPATLIEEYRKTGRATYRDFDETRTFINQTYQRTDAFLFGWRPSCRNPRGWTCRCRRSPQAAQGRRP